MLFIYNKFLKCHWIPFSLRLHVILNTTIDWLHMRGAHRFTFLDTSRKGGVAYGHDKCINAHDILWDVNCVYSVWPQKITPRVLDGHWGIIFSLLRHPFCWGPDCCIVGVVASTVLLLYDLLYIVYPIFQKKKTHTITFVQNIWHRIKIKTK